MIVVRTTPAVVEPPYVPPVASVRDRVLFEWVGVDGSRWDLSNGPVFLLPGVSGLEMPVPAHRHRVAAGFDGGTWQGMRIESREIGMPVGIGILEWQEMVDVARRFRQSYNPSAEGTLIARLPDSRSRQIRLRYQEGGEGQWDKDPLFRGQAFYDLTMLADIPWWHGEPITRLYGNNPPPNIFPGPPFNLASGFSLTNDKVSNPGELGAWPVWTVYGPFTGFTVGVGPSVATMTLTKPLGGWVRIDTTPGRGSIMDEAGNNQIGAMDDVTFVPIPPGDDIPLSLSVVGGTTASYVELNFTPNYWGIY